MRENNQKQSRTNIEAGVNPFLYQVASCLADRTLAMFPEMEIKTKNDRMLAALYVLRERDFARTIKESGSKPEIVWQMTLLTYEQMEVAELGLTERDLCRAIARMTYHIGVTEEPGWPEKKEDLIRIMRLVVAGAALRNLWRSVGTMIGDVALGNLVMKRPDSAGLRFKITGKGERCTEWGPKGHFVRFALNNCKDEM